MIQISPEDRNIQSLNQSSSSVGNSVPTARKREVAKIITRCTTLTYDLYMVFYMPPLVDLPIRRYTSTNPVKQLECIVITRETFTADRLLYDWIIEDTKNPLSSEFDCNLLILSESEFIDSFETLDSFRERVIKSTLVYERDPAL